MKKKFSMFAALAALISVSCVTENSPSVVDDLADKVSITVKIPGKSSSTRAPETAASSATYTPKLKDGGRHYIYVLENDVVKGAYEFNAFSTEYSLAEGAKIFSKDAKVYVLANIPSDIVDPDKFGSMDAIKRAVTAISYNSGEMRNTEFEYPAMGNWKENSAAALSISAPDDGKTEVTVPVAPLYARIEIQGITGGEWISEFKLKHVYLNQYYSSFSMTGDASVSHDIAGDPAAFDSNWFGDAVTSDNAWTAAPGTAITAGTGQVWAYHVGAGNIAQIWFALEDVKRYTSDGQTPEAPTSTVEDNYMTDPGFVVVNGYKEAGVDVTEFVRGKIYSIKTVKFNRPGLPDFVTISATVTVEDWVPHTLDPQVLE